MQSSKAPGYEDALKVRLAARLRGLLRLAGLSLWASLSCTTFHPSLLLYSWLDVFTLQIALKACWSLVALLGLLPLLFWRKQRLAQGLTTPLPPTQLSNASRLTQKSLYATLAIYLASWSVLFLVWCRVAQFSSPEASLKVFVHIKIWQINPRFVYLLLVSSTAAILAGVRHEIKRESDLRFPFTSTPDPIPARAIASFLQKFMKSSVPILITLNFGFPVLWLLFRRPILKTLVYHTVFRPYFASLYRHINISSSLLLRTAALTTFLFISWDLLNALFDVYMTQPILLSHFASSPNQVLLQGLKLPNEHRRFLALLELANLVRKNPERRKTIFKGVAAAGQSNEDNSFDNITSQCLKLLKDAQEVASKRGNISVPVQQAGDRPAASRPSLPAVEVKTGTITKPVKPNFFDRLAKTQTDAPASPARPAPSAAPSTPSSTPSSIPKIFQTPTSTPQKSSSASLSASTEMTTRPAVQSLPSTKLVQWTEMLLTKVASARIRDSPSSRWLLKSVPSSTVKRIVAHPEASIWIVEALTTLMLASLNEDEYGKAQKSLVKIVDAFVSHAQVLEGVIKELGSGADEEMQEVLKLEVQPLLHTLQNGIRSILQAFGPYMTEFKWPPKLAETLQAYKDWS